MKYFQVFFDSTVSYSKWLWSQITLEEDTLWGNYFYFLIIVSLLFFVLEWFFPWRKKQPKIRIDFWLDTFYMFFNFFAFSVIVFAGISEVGVMLWLDFLSFLGVQKIVMFNVSDWPNWIQLLTLFVLKDFIEWWIHRMLHTVPFLWKFHQVHHSAKQMGFAAHLRFHWMENVLYKSIEYVPLAIIGFGLDDFFLVHAFAIVIGHWNHANFRLPIGPFRFLLNNPSMHIWHHAKHLPIDRTNGVNFGLTLSVWDYIFRTNYEPYDGRDIELGFAEDEYFPKTFKEQLTQGFNKK
ncbi:sterol desaturase family protein [Reichenbachiella versicolor]|uniref:sterol desaturase family protein n=1 Tax=Reichenbachiella versicolor TaxID=1821036 RepID=UPI000D6DDD74|nr:sterol desaturase family protein [Reichenbachiella versicolor]